MRPRARVLAAVATHRTRSVRTAAPRPHRAQREVEPQTAAGASTSTDWLLRTLVVLIGFAMLALLLAASSELPRARPAVSRIRARIGSKGLSTSRIDLGRDAAVAPPPGRGISYRD